MNYKTDFMKYFIDSNNQVYQMIGYCSSPTVILQNVSTKETFHIVPDAPKAQEYRKSIAEEPIELITKVEEIR